jgi:hypothetical protein
MLDENSPPSGALARADFSRFHPVLCFTITAERGKRWLSSL